MYVKRNRSKYVYRWFIEYDLNQKVPHFSTFRKNYTRRFKETDAFERIYKQETVFLYMRTFLYKSTSWQLCVYSWKKKKCGV